MDAAPQDEPDPLDELQRLARVARLKPLGSASRVQVMALTGPVDDGAVESLARDLRGVAEGEAVVVELDSVGGTPAAVKRALELVRAVKGPTVVFIKGQASGEAALLPLAAQVVVLAPDARWGAISSTQFSARRISDVEKNALAETFRETARLAGRPQDWAAAMVVAPSFQPTQDEPTKGEPAKDEPTKGEPTKNEPTKAGAATKTSTATKPGTATTPARPLTPPQGRLVTLTPREAIRVGMAELVRRDFAALAHRVGWEKREALRSGKTIEIPQAPAEGVKGTKDPQKIVDGTRRIVVVTISGTIELGLQSFVQRVLKTAKAGDLVVLDIDTFGGRVDAATQIRDGLLRTKAKTVALINPRAISAGALISLACDLIVMVPGASIGAATPVQSGGTGPAQPVGEKYVSYMRKEFKATAEAKGRRGDIAEAMVDMSVDVEDIPEELKATISGLQKGKLLTLTTEEAMTLGMAEMRAQDLADFVGKMGLGDVPMIRPKVNWAEEISRFLTGPVVSGLLMTIGILGLLLELYSPGFGVSGIIGISCLLLFFFGHKITGVAGWEPLALFIVGVTLLGVEIFVTTGFGLLGSVGVLAVVGSLVWTLMGPGGIPLTVSWEAGYLTSALTRVFVAVILVAGLMAVALRFIPRGAGPFRRLILHAVVDGDASSGAHDLPDGALVSGDLLGREGITETALRPTGQVRLGTKRIEVESLGGFIEKGVPVKVVEVEGRRVVVKELKEKQT